MPDGSSNYEWFKDGVSVGTGTSYTVDGSTAGFEGDYEVEMSGIGVCSQRSPIVTMTNAGGFTVTRVNSASVVVLPAQPETLTVTTDTPSPTFEWFRNGVSLGNDSATLEITQDGTYYAAVTSIGVCSSTVNSETTEAVIPSSFEIEIDYNGSYENCVSTFIDVEVSQINAIASDGSSSDVTSQVAGSFTYQWQLDGVDVAGQTNQNISLTNITENGDYTVDAVLTTYNVSSNTIPVNLLTSETVSITSTGTIFCSTADALTISTTTDLSSETFDWELDGVRMNVTTESLVAASTGAYRLVLEKNGCDLYSNEIVIAGLDPNLITLDIDGDVIFPEGSSRTVTASGGTAYEWLDPSNNIMSSTDSMTFTEEGTFTLIANIDNCQITRQLTAIFLDTFKVPNVITPNGDGANDQWVIPNSYSNNSDVNVVIYNDKGVELVNEMGYQNNWPESSASFPSQNMVFYYVIKNASETLKQGTITVIR
jgi:gliding motility-associated-like protein